MSTRGCRELPADINSSCVCVLCIAMHTNNNNQHQPSQPTGAVIKQFTNGVIEGGAVPEASLSYDGQYLLSGKR